jgi:ectoine hydroxylase-related dioxygenase (phytanoyl-CoA dioxygenase family)
MRIVAIFVSKTGLNEAMQIKPGTVEELQSLLHAGLNMAPCALAHSTTLGVPHYDAAKLRVALQKSPEFKAELMDAFNHIWAHGAGVLVLQNLFADSALLDASTVQFQAMIDAEKLSGQAVGDHFAKPGANDRVWNALEKLCLAAPGVFAAYYGNPLLALVCEAWLGPAYQVTSQVNCVNPGGQAQRAHRDYHLGFLSPAQGALYPAHVHAMSPFLTLQGAVAHVDMPLQSGPTLYLPHSQKFASGYLVADQAEFQAFFDAQRIQLPLKKGDAVFFNPALLHAAGHNQSANIRRMANLLQVSSAFGRAMESVDRTRMAQRLYPALLALQGTGNLSAEAAHSAIAACAEGYAFPTNLDRDPPLAGLAPPSQQALMVQALQANWPVEKFDRELQQHAVKKLTS